MDTTQVTQVLRESILVALKIGGPILILCMLVGVVVAILQAVTQINEQSISFLLKLIVVILVLFLGGGWMLNILLDYTRYLFTLMLN